MEYKIGQRISHLQLAKNTLYVNCLWPKFDEPTSIFEAGSSDLTVMGTPCPRNIIFPPDTVFLHYSPDAMFEAYRRVRKSRDLTPDEAQEWVLAYYEAVGAGPETQAMHETAPISEPELIMVEKESYMKRFVKWFRAILRLS